jgi:hypothetical protein
MHPATCSCVDIRWVFVATAVVQVFVPVMKGFLLTTVQQPAAFLCAINIPWVFVATAVVQVFVPVMKGFCAAPFICFAFTSCFSCVDIPRVSAAAAAVVL